MPEESDKEDVKKGKNGQGMNWFYRKFFSGKAGVWTAISTVVMCVFTGLLWQVSNVANETNRATQRATLRFNGPGFVKVLSPDGKKWTGINIFEGLSNSGSVPALNGEVQYNIASEDEIPATGAEFMQLPQSKTMNVVVAPHNGFQLAPVSLTVENLEQIGKNNKHLFFWGWISYNDGFLHTPKRLTEFCTEITAVSWSKLDHTDPTGDLQTSNPPCKSHNCYADRCDDYEARTR